MNTTKLQRSAIKESVYKNIINKKIKKILQLKLLAVFFFLTTTAHSQVSTIFNGVKFGNSLKEVKTKIKFISKSIKLVEIRNPSFPLSKNKEKHLIASKVELENGTIKKVAFTFSDNKLSYIQANGNVIKSIIPKLKGKIKTHLGYQVYFSDLLFLNLETDKAWFLTPESLHLNLFTWNNPYLKSNTETKYNPSAKIPSFLKMEEKLEDLLPALKENSRFLDIETIESTNSIKKTQVNSFGIEYAGFPRKFEVRFENNKMTKVWILTGKQEENRIRKKLTDQYGKSIFENDNWVVFNNWTVLLRKDKPEILLITNKLGLKYKKQYSK